MRINMVNVARFVLGHCLGDDHKLATDIIEAHGKLRNRVAELEGNLKGVSAGRELAVTLKVRTGNVTASLEDLSDRLRDVPVSKEAQDAIRSWLKRHIKIEVDHG